MPDQSTTTPLHMRVITSPGTRAIVALAAGLIAGAALAHEQPGGGTAAGPLSRPDPGPSAGRMAGRQAPPFGGHDLGA